ncbi:hypothetical protein IAD21_03422 [Abditibacteriota bacterium]|nr:hypothetical protein IAD21_03422 [Abditibacteriota bacterium]
MKRAFTLVEALIVVAVVLVLAAFLWPVFDRMRNGARRVSCQSNLKQIGLGFMQYERDYDEKFPPARATSASGWANVLQPYVKSTQLFQCPSAVRTTTGFSSDYFYNRRLSRLSLAKIGKTTTTILMGDGEAASTWNSWTGLPADAATNPNSPAQRHLQGANYGYVDGHVKWVTPQNLSRQAKWSPQ